LGGQDKGDMAALAKQAGNVTIFNIINHSLDLFT